MRNTGERYDPAMRITDPTAAALYFDELVKEQMEAGGLTRETAETIERANLGYWAGYYSNETRAQVERLFKCKHPVFGAIAENGPPTFGQAFQAGLAKGKAIGGPGEARAQG